MSAECWWTIPTCGNMADEDAAHPVNIQQLDDLLGEI
jgi:hypothetical protein